MTRTSARPRAGPDSEARAAAAQNPRAATEIRIENARSHNLKGVSCRIPLGALTVVSGVSGSGKSTLVFDTLYAEGQRRYVASLSTYARQFLERLPRPEVDHISNLPPAIAIEQRNRVTNARSTVGTATEILDHLRLLFAKVGETHCGACDAPVDAGTVESVAERMRARWDGARVSLGTAIVRAKGESAAEHRERLLRDGFARLLTPDGSVVDLAETSATAFSKLRNKAWLLVDRLRVDAGGSRARLAEAVSACFGRGGGELVAVVEGGEIARYHEGFVCDGCGARFLKPQPALFAFNSPLGACETCQGFGRVPGLDLERVIPDRRKSLEGLAIVPFSTKAGRKLQRDLLRACRDKRIPTAKPYEELSESQQRFVVDGDDESWYGIRGYFEWLEKKRYRVSARVQIARYRRFDPCPDCRATRLRPEALAVRVDGKTIADVSQLTIDDLAAWLHGLALVPAQQAKVKRLLDALRVRVETAREVGLGYLSLARQARTLSGGEAQRIQLATALGGTLTASLYVLDEPSIGLHPRDVDRLLGVMRSIRDHGNTVVVVEHAPEIVEAADYVIELGPAAGRRGGELIVEGDVAAIRRHATSATGRALRGDFQAQPVASSVLKFDAGRLRIRGARANNLKNIDVEIPLGCLVAVTGVSGAGKTSLIRSVLVGNLERDPERGECKSIDGAERVAGVVLVDPVPPARSPRSNPATVTKAFEGIRKRFAATREAKAKGATPGWFSFNTVGGRCETCEGAGEILVDMQFLENLRVPCEQCEGKRYKPEALAVRLEGRTIADVLELTVEEALVVFARDRLVASRLEPLARVGLSYITLGQPLSTLSGGESQRLRIALALAQGHSRTLYVLDEPTTGLHPSDIEVLIRCLRDLIDAGGSVITIEHNLEFIRAADHVIDIGPEGGPGGGELVCAGTPAAVAACSTSHTGAALRGEF